MRVRGKFEQIESFTMESQRYTSAHLIDVGYSTIVNFFGDSPNIITDGVGSYPVITYMWHFRFLKFRGKVIYHEFKELVPLKVDNNPNLLHWGVINVMLNRDWRLMVENTVLQYNLSDQFTEGLIKTIKRYDQEGANYVRGSIIDIFA